MPDILSLLLIALAAGLAIPAGGWLASHENIHPRWLEDELHHGVMGVGAGALLSAVALVLIPEGIRPFSPLAAAAWVVTGAVVFMGVDILLTKLDLPGSNLAAMISDYIPESLALGTIAATGGSVWLVGVLIGVQNLPEGFNAFRELREGTSLTAHKILRRFLYLALLGPMFAVLGYFWLADHEFAVAAIMLAAAGGILYSVFQDMAPQIHMENHWLPPMGCIAGFVIGLIGFMLENP